MKANEIMKIRRQELGLTQKEVADRVGVTEATVSRWESGDIKNMRRDRIADILEHLAAVGNVQGYIKNLIRQDMKRS